MKLIDAAKTFLQSKSAKHQAFHNREHELRTKITELEAKKSAKIAEYDPTTPFDPKQLAKIDAQIADAHKEIAVLNENKQATPQFDPSEVAEHVENVRKEASEQISVKKAEEEKARAAIEKAKKAFLDAQAKHHNVRRQAADIATDANETISQLTIGIAQELGKLHRKAQELDLKAFRLSGDGSASGLRSDQHQVDQLRDELSEIRREITRLEGFKAEVTAGIPELKSYRDNNGKTIYFAHEAEQTDAADKGKV
ncbi:coiled-coil domain-containing protein [Virgibacillus necropolis]|uniref:Uncharacterized protein n=1 Tax=Virgibacillus necropolis TaxID=163877 RepID=A0A221MCF0_9BACI|nr:hypothetical protein [Virgibacillus necropolis]ASN05311.1 hypothetical protein CFK40_09945 [Virgibacillus necropolis]